MALRILCEGCGEQAKVTVEMGPSGEYVHLPQGWRCVEVFVRNAGVAGGEVFPMYFHGEPCEVSSEGRVGVAWLLQRGK